MKLNRLMLCFGLILTLVFASVLVSAEREGCCTLTNNEGPCVWAKESDCDFDSGGVLHGSTSCADVQSCKIGCCYDEGEGICNPNALKSACTEDWEDEPNCRGAKTSNICELGCCVFEDEVIYEIVPRTTKKWCEEYTDDTGRNPYDWRDISDANCWDLEENPSLGACVSAGRCTMKTGSNCLGDFNPGYLCTSPELGNLCEKTENTRCENGKVYFLDDCGNIANIYYSGRYDDPTYWNKIIGINESCGFEIEGGNGGSPDCGNCDNYLGGICASAAENNFNVNMGEFYCKDTSCTYKREFWDDGGGPNYQDETYRNGESWCVYDGSIGNGTDTVGSKHWRYVCKNGIVELDGCHDTRNEICVQNFLRDGNNPIKAECVKNDWEKCIDYNDEEDGATKCNEDPLCEIRTVQIATTFKHSVCAPKYPGGFELSDAPETGGEDSELRCSRGTRICTYWDQWVIVEGATSGWECSINCGCRTPVWWDQMNDICISLGDCGSYVNYVGGEIGIESPYIKYMEDSFIDTPEYLDEVGEGDLIQLWSDMRGSNARVDAARRGAAIGGYTAFPPLAAIAAPIGAAIGAITTPEMAFRPTHIPFICKPWKQPTGNDNCSLCNNDILEPCNKYRCESLGAGCEVIDGNEGKMCVPKANDELAPIISPLMEVSSPEDSVGIKFGEDTSEGFILIPDTGEKCFEPYTQFTFGVHTSKPAYCKFDTKMNEFENMAYDFGGSNYWAQNHMTIHWFKDPSHGESQGLNINATQTFYIKCQDRFGNENSGFYTIDMCVNEAPDMRAPRITKIIPDKMLRYGTNKTEVSVITNELATCKWDYANIDYDAMANQMTCLDELGSPSYLGRYVCIGEFETINTTNNYYIRCKDQPWLDEEGINRGDERNANKESESYKLRKPEEKIRIERIIPDSDWDIFMKYTDVELKVKTTGGGEHHTCSYYISDENDISNYNKVAKMYETGGDGTNAHRQQLISLSAKVYYLYIKCKDETGDSTQEMSTFRIIHDTSPPIVSTIYQKDDTLYMNTGEETDNCYYSTEDNDKGCRYSCGDRNSMSRDGHKHTISGIIAGKIYYIKCCDDPGENAPDKCSIEWFGIKGY